MIVNTARFLVSSATVDKAPDTKMHEYAFIGRSNVGKSSLINMLTGRKGLAMTSSTPGKTMLINHFVINDKWCIVDLPGYGFAQRSKTDLARIDKMIRDYILYRKEMTNLFLLIDSRHEPQKIDMKFMEWLGENGVPFSIVFTKLDKQSKTVSNHNIALYTEKLLEFWEELPPIFATSAIDGRGREQLLDYIAELNKLPLYSEDTDQPDNENNDSNNQNIDDMKPTEKPTTSDLQAQEKYPGAAIDAADDDKVTAAAVKERTCVLDENPRNNDLDQ